MKLSYRPEIDGLRAIAVVAVILYHAQINISGHEPFKGGFIGVDIFFVISGYLITSILLKELVTTGSVSFKHFYERRIRRLLPALMFVMLASLPFAWIYLLPNSFIDFSKSILYSLGFTSNFYFHYTGQEYGAVSGFLKPFLHTWSLSVEEQYYILFPIVLLFAFKYFRKYLIYILILGFVISLGLADWASRNYPSLNFYALPTRGWELLAGSILSYFEIKMGHRSKHQTLNLILPSIGLALILINIIFFKLYFPHPSLYTFSSILGVCLIIWFSNPNEMVTKILSTKLFVGIGLISYSLYLWHYPIFAFDRITEFTQGSFNKKLLIGIIIIILSIISYYFVERPGRNKKYSFKYVLSLIIISISILIISNMSVIFKEGYKNRIPEILQNNFYEPWNALKNSEGNVCDGLVDGCRFNTTSNKKVYIIGDSHMGSIISNLKNRVVEKNYQFITFTLRCCLYFPGFNLIETRTQKINKKCNNEYFQKLKEILSKEKNSIFIFGGRTTVYLTNYMFNNQEGGVEVSEWDHQYLSEGNYNTLQKSFRNEVLELSKNNKIILIYPIPEQGWDPNYKIWLNRNNNFSNNNYDEYITTSFEVYNERNKLSFELLDSIKNDNIFKVYPHKLFCNTIIKGRCLAHDDKNIFYADDDHPSPKGAEMINNLIIEEIEKME